MPDLSVYACLILESIGGGWRLRIPFDDSGVERRFAATLVENWSDFGKPPNESVKPRPAIGPLEVAPVEELLKSGLLHKMVPDQVNQRFGWKQCGLNGKLADFYCMVQ